MAGRWAGLGRWLRAEAAFVLVMLAMLGCVAFLFFESRHWRIGSGAIAATLLFAAVLRAVVPAPYAGLLAVRGRVRDTVALAVMGGVVLAVAIRVH